MVATTHAYIKLRASTCVVVGVCQQDLAPGVTLGAIIHSSALCLTLDLPRRFSFIRLNVSRPLSDHWGQAEKVCPEHTIDRDLLIHAEKLIRD